MSFSVKVTGVKDVESLLKKTIKKTDVNVIQAIKEAGLFTEGEVKKSIAGRKAEPASVDTGFFLRSVNSTSEGFTATIGTNVSYAKFLEFGTSRLAPRRHFRNSKDRNFVKIVEFINKAVIKATK